MSIAIDYPLLSTIKLRNVWVECMNGMPKPRRGKVTDDLKVVFIHPRITQCRNIFGDVCLYCKLLPQVILPTSYNRHFLDIRYTFLLGYRHVKQSLKFFFAF